MTEKDLQLIRDLIEGAISEFHCPPCEEDEWLTTKQFCERFQISEPTLKKMRRAKRIKHVRFGNTYRYLFEHE